MEVITVMLALFVGAVVVFGLSAGYAVINGIVLSILWSWFMVPVFHLPHLGIAEAIGVSLVVSWLTYRDDGAAAVDPTKETAATRTTAMFKPFARAAMTLLFGFVLKQLL